MAVSACKLRLQDPGKEVEQWMASLYPLGLTCSLLSLWVVLNGRLCLVYSGKEEDRQLGMESTYL